MKEVANDSVVDPKRATNKKDITAFVLSLVMFIGGGLYFKYINVMGSQAGWSIIIITTFIFQLFCIGLSLITVLVGQLFSKNKAALASIKTKAFWLDRVIGGFVNWIILMGFILAGHFL